MTREQIEAIEKSMEHAVKRRDPSHIDVPVEDLRRLLAAARRSRELEEAALSLARILERILDDIPARRDWLDPDLERVAREVINNARRGM